MDPIQNQAPVANESKKSMGSVVAIVVVIILLAVVAFYVWGGSSTPAVENVALPTVSSSDEVNSIQADLGAGTGADINLNVADVESALK